MKKQEPKSKVKWGAPAVRPVTGAPLLSVANEADLRTMSAGVDAVKLTESQLPQKPRTAKMVDLSEKIAKETAKQLITAPTKSQMHVALTRKGQFKFIKGERVGDDTVYGYNHKDGRATLVTIAGDEESWVMRYPADGVEVRGKDATSLIKAVGVSAAKHKARLDRAEKRVETDRQKAAELAEKQLEAAKDTDIGWVAPPVVTQVLDGGPPDHVVKALLMLDELTAHRMDFDFLKGDKHYSDRVALINVLFNRGRGSLKTKVTETGVTKVAEAFYSAVGFGDGKNDAAKAKKFAERSAELIKMYRTVLGARKKVEKKAWNLNKAMNRVEVPGKIIPPDKKKTKKQRAEEDAQTRQEVKAKALLAVSAEQPAIPHPDAELALAPSDICLLEDPVNGLVMMQMEKSNSQGAICIYNNGSRVAAGVVAPATLKKLRPIKDANLIEAANQLLNPLVPSVPVTSVAARHLTAVIHCKELQPMKTEAAAKKFAPPAKAAVKGAKAPKTAPVTAAEGAKKDSTPRTSGGYAGKKIKVLNKNHGARPGTKRAKAMDILIASKTTDEAIPKIVKIGANNSFIAFAIREGFINLS